LLSKKDKQVSCQSDESGIAAPFMPGSPAPIHAYRLSVSGRLCVSCGAAQAYAHLDTSCHSAAADKDAHPGFQLSGAQLCRPLFKRTRDFPVPLFPVSDGRPGMPFASHIAENGL